MKKPKIIAHYLPQFHSIPENDAWWGKGFTEWTAARSAIPMFNGHNQPRVPLNNNYYNLLDKKTMLYQADLASKYGIDAFSIYHYWFKDGRKILEKPAENLLNWNDININYCFNWANESWARTWSKLNEKNVWADVFDKKQDKNDNGILLEQKYGNEDDWLQHIHYLIPFFKDKRYLKKDGKPVFIIYKPNDIKCLSDMLECWEKELKQEGFPGIYLIAEITNVCKPIYSADSFLIHNPSYSNALYNAKTLSVGFKLLDYDAFWQSLINIPWEKLTGNTTYLCGNIDYDNTPRRGGKGSAMEGVTVEKFELYFSQLYQKTIKENKEFVFLNAWNEWGEGMYLEPDTVNKYGFLEAVKNVISSADIDNNHIDNNNYDQKVIEHLILENVALNKYYYISKETQNLYDNWMLLLENKKAISDYLIKRGVKKIAIYGAGNIGRHLLKNLLQTEIQISYILDNSETGKISNIDIIKLNPNMQHVDCIINTVIGRYETIKNEIRKYCDYHTMTVEHIINEMT